MNAFDITSLAPGATAIIDWRPRHTHRGWDTIAAVAVGRMSVDALRAKFVPGKRAGIGAGFILMDCDPEPLPGGWSRAALTLQGIFAVKKFGQVVPASISNSKAGGILLTTGAPNYNTPGTASNYTSFANLTSHEGQIGYQAEVIDAIAPVPADVGKGQRVTPYAGLTFPVMTESSNPWKFNNPLTDATRHEPYGWVQTALEVEEIGSVSKLYRKVLTYHWQWKYTP